MRWPFGPPFPALDSVSLRNGVSGGLINGFLNELSNVTHVNAEKVPGHTLLSTHIDGDPIDGFYETISGTMLAYSNGKVFRVNPGGALTAFTGDLCTVGAYPYWAEDRENVYMAHGGRIARVDVRNQTVTLQNENTPSNVTHICRAKGYLLCNGDQPSIAGVGWEESQVFDNSSSLGAVAVLTDKPGWITATGRLEVAPGAVGRIYLSKDNGVNWTKVYTDTSSGGSNTHILALEYLGGGIVLAGTGDVTGEILRSTDYGVTWTLQGPPGVSLTMINCIRKISATVVLAGTGRTTNDYGKIFRSTDAGLTWTEVGGAGYQSVTEIEPLTLDGSVVIAAAVNNAGGGVAGVRRSADAGATWGSFTSLSGTGYIPAIQRINDTIAIMSNGLTGSATAQKIWRSTNAGITWVLQPEIPDFSDNAIPSAFCLTSTGELIMGTTGDTLAAGGAQIWKSNDLGVTWALLSELNLNKDAAVKARGLKETHSAGTLIATGRVAFGLDGADTAIKWQSALSSPVAGDVFFSDDIAHGYQAVTSWEVFNAE